MALAHADNHLDLPGHGIAPVRDARPGRVAPPAPLAPFPAERSLERSAAPPSARPEAGSDTDVGIGASTATDSDIDTSIDIDIDDRDLAFAPIPLFRETDPAEDLAHAFVPILDLRGSEPRPLPWETAAADDEFIVDPAVVAERLEDLPPPIPFSRNQPRG